MTLRYSNTKRQLNNVINGSWNVNTTVATGKTLTITDADALTVGGIIVPQYVVLTVDLNANSVDKNIFIADAAYRVVSIKEVHSVAGSTGAAVNVTKCTGTTAPGSGTAMMSSDFNLTGTANTVLTGTLSTTTSDITLAAGNRIGINVSGTLTNLVGCLTIVLKRV